MGEIFTQLDLTHMPFLTSMGRSCTRVRAARLIYFIVTCPRGTAVIGNIFTENHANEISF